MKYSVTSVILPDLDVVETCQLLQELGYDGVEWRVTPDPGDKSRPTFWYGNRSSMTAEELIERARPFL
mgnify:CR=1 FL=1